MDSRTYNELFLKMDIKTPQGGNLISGPKFFKIINEFDKTHEDYYQYIDERTKRGLSTTRKVFCKEVLEKLDDDIRESVINRINQIVNEYKSKEECQQLTLNNFFTSKPSDNTFKSTSFEIINEFTKNKLKSENVSIVKPDFIKVTEPTVFVLKVKNPIVFISYSWDDEPHKEWVLRLSADLRKNGIITLLDRYFLNPGSNASVFMEKSIEDADKVLIIFTDKYKSKANGRIGGVGVEYSMMNIDLCNNIAGNTKYIPILRRGTLETSIPLSIRPYIASYMTNDDEYNDKLKELIHAIFDQSIISAPLIGEIPDYIKEKEF